MNSLRHPFIAAVLVPFWFYAFCLPLPALPLWVSSAGAGTSTPAYTVNTAVFDGTNDYIRSDASGDTGWADGTAVSFAVWVKFGAVGVAQHIMSCATGSSAMRLECYVSAANLIRFRAADSASAIIVDLSSSSTVTTGTWYQIHFAIDTTSSANTKLWINGVEDTSLVETTLSGTMDMAYTGDRFTIGGNAAVPAVQRLNGSLAELWCNDSYVGNNALFISGGKPVNLGTNGATPTGSQPCFYFSGAGSGDTWRANQGSANNANWTLTGTLGTDTSP